MHRQTRTISYDRDIQTPYQQKTKRATSTWEVPRARTLQTRLMRPINRIDSSLSQNTTDSSRVKIDYGFHPVQQHTYTANIKRLPFTAQIRIRDQKPTYNIRLNDVLKELWYNKNVKEMYDVTMFNEKKEHFRLMEEQYQQSRRHERPQVHMEQKKRLQSIKDLVAQSDAEQYMNKITTEHLQPKAYGSVSRKTQNHDLQYTLPQSREGAKAIKVDNKILLLGGHSIREHGEVSIMNLQTHQWEPQSKFFPSQRLGSHFQVVQSQSCLYAFGGERRDPGRRNTSDLYKFSGFQWEKLDYVGDLIDARKNHTMIAVGKILIINGGIGNDKKYFSDFHALDLNLLKNTLLCPLQSNVHCEEFITDGIAFHTAFITHNFDVQLYQTYKKQQPEDNDGIFIYGGKNSKERANHRLFKLKVGQVPHRLEEVVTKGKIPSGRYNFASAYSPKGQIFIVHGGMDDHRILNDMFILFMKQMFWVQVKLVGEHLRPRFGHCSVLNETQFIIFGGAGNEGFLSFEPFVIELTQKKLNQ